MDSSTDQLLMIILALVFVALNGFFVLSEFAIVKVRKSKLEELAKKNKSNAKLALKITKSLDTYLSATQLGITLSSLALGWIGEPAIAKILYQLFTNFFDGNLILLHTFSVIIAFTFITFLHIVFGELIPKSIAIAKSESSTLLIARPLCFFRNIFSPLIFIFENISNYLLKKIGIESSKNENAHSDEEIKIIIGESLKGGYIDSIESEIIKNAVDFSDTTAKEIMTPRKDVVFLFEDNTYEENIEIVKQTNHTRYPYCKDGKDNVIGMIHIRDLLQLSLSNDENKNLSKIAKKLMIVPENNSISNILIKMNKDQIHTALVVDEYGGTAGLLTMEDILEEIMGNISSSDENRNDEGITKINENTYKLSGMVGLENVAEIIGLGIDDDVEEVTIGGYVFNLLGKEPIIGDSIVNGNFVFEILEVDGMRIKTIKIQKLDSNKDSNDEEF